MAYITPAHVAREAGIDPNTARRFLAQEFPKETGPRSQQRFDESQLPTLVALCKSKRKRKCLNRFNAIRRNEVGAQ